MGQDFPSTLRRLRERRALTQKALAQAIGLSPAMVGLLEAGERRPTRQQIQRAADALEVTPAERDALLVAGGHLPAAYDRVSPCDPDVLLVAEVLGDPALSEGERREFRCFIRLASQRWRPGTLDLEPLAEQLTPPSAGIAGGAGSSSEEARDGG